MIASLALTLTGMFLLPVDLWIKGRTLMGLTIAIASCGILTEALRDRQESTGIEEPKTERRLVGLTS
jgi:hypothetical protein